MLNPGQGPSFKLSSSFTLIPLIAALGMLVACTSGPERPDQLLAQTELRIDAAEDAQAGREAPLELRTARDQLSDARRSIQAEDYAAARRNLEKALVNADYAIAKSRSDKTQEAAEEVRKTIDTLRRELEPAPAAGEPKMEDSQ
jgi:hypothetical protein